MASPSNWFTSEIQQMMFGFGDSKRPLPETAALVEEIVHQQMITLIHQAWDVALMRGDKQVSLEDILFLLRKDKVKLKRLFHYLEVRDMKNIYKNTVAGGDDGKLDPTVGPGQDKLGLDKRGVMGKNRHLCYNFFSSIDQTGELLALFEDTEPDMFKHERMMRAELQAQGMDPQQYMEFCRARQANFSRRYNKSQRFRDWLHKNLSPDIVLAPTAMEIFSYMAYECVAQIVDLALLVKQDMRAVPGDPLSRVRPPVCINYAELQATSSYNKAETGTLATGSPPYETSANSQIIGAATASRSLTATTDAASSGNTTPTGSSQIASAGNMALTAANRNVNKKKRKRSGQPVVSEGSVDSTILPSDIREAMRRYSTDIGPFTSSINVRGSNSIPCKTLCS